MWKKYIKIVILWPIYYVKKIIITSYSLAGLFYIFFEVKAFDHQFGIILWQKNKYFLGHWSLQWVRNVLKYCKLSSSNWQITSFFVFYSFVLFVEYTVMRQKNLLLKKNKINNLTVMFSNKSHGKMCTKLPWPFQHQFKWIRCWPHRYINTLHI